jgi:endonuclease/exonuclease/phosphatase (EEP) superfamily protein YafD
MKTGSNFHNASYTPYADPTTRDNVAVHSGRDDVAKEADDFFGIWRSMLQQWDARTNETLTKVTGQESFSRDMNRAMGMSLQMQAAFNEAVEKALVALNLPSRADVARLSEQLNGIERKLDALKTAAPAAETAASRAARPARTRKPPGKEGTT